MPEVSYVRGSHAGAEYITVFHPDLDEPKVATSNHRNWDKIVNAVHTPLSAAEVEELFNVAVAVERAFQKITERVAVEGSTVLFDGDPIHSAEAAAIIRFLDEGLPVEPLAHFLEKVRTNPEPGSVEQLYEWLRRHAFSLTEDGDIIAYKGVHGDRRSTLSGGATVNGERVEGYVPNEDGSVIELPRSAVEFNPAVGCSTGLHVGTHSYASNHAAICLEVHVNPRDIVSVPTDCDAQKVRCCRYTVVREIESEYTSACPSLAAEPEHEYVTVFCAPEDTPAEYLQDPGIWVAIDTHTSRTLEEAVEYEAGYWSDNDWYSAVPGDVETYDASSATVPVRGDEARS